MMVILGLVYVHPNNNNNIDGSENKNHIITISVSTFFMFKKAQTGRLEKVKKIIYLQIPERNFLYLYRFMSSPRCDQVNIFHSIFGCLSVKRK